MVVLYPVRSPRELLILLLNGGHLQTRIPLSMVDFCICQAALYLYRKHNVISLATWLQMEVQFLLINSRLSFFRGSLDVSLVNNTVQKEVEGGYLQ